MTENDHKKSKGEESCLQIPSPHMEDVWVQRERGDLDINLSPEALRMDWLRTDMWPCQAHFGAELTWLLPEESFSSWVFQFLVGICEETDSTISFGPYGDPGVGEGGKRMVTSKTYNHPEPAGAGRSFHLLVNEPLRLCTEVKGSLPGAMPELRGYSYCQPWPSRKEVRGRKEFTSFSCCLPNSCCILIGWL
jgi:hypothetical protein